MCVGARRAASGSASCSASVDAYEWCWMGAEGVDGAGGVDAAPGGGVAGTGGVDGAVREPADSLLGDDGDRGIRDDIFA